MFQSEGQTVLVPKKQFSINIFLTHKAAILNYFTAMHLSSFVIVSDVKGRFL